MSQPKEKVARNPPEIDAVHGHVKPFRCPSGVELRAALKDSAGYTFCGAFDSHGAKNVHAKHAS